MARLYGFLYIHAAEEPGATLNLRSHIVIAALILGRLTSARADPPPPAGPDVDAIYQYFLPSDAAGSRPHLGAYLWIPPHTMKIRAVMIGIHNGLPINILQSPQIRGVCRKHGIAQILMMPWAEDIGGVMLKDLSYDVNDPKRTAVYDSYIQRLADLSGHAELVTSPIIPLAHSAFCSFPLESAVRKPEQCMAAIPVKAGLPDVYAIYAAGRKAEAPNADLCLRNVPVLFIGSSSQETVEWSPYPHALQASGIGSYRRDQDDNPGTAYHPRNELFGNCWDMMSGHFDMLPRNYQFVAEWLDAIATARLPTNAGEPLNNMLLKDGWLMDPNISAIGDLSKDYARPAPYLQFTGRRKQALWFPNEPLARGLFELGRDEPRKKIELITFLDPTGVPISLAHGAMATMPNPQLLLHEDGLLTLTTYHFTAPPDICTIKDKDHLKNPNARHVYANMLFPDKAGLPTSQIPLKFHAHGGAFQLVKAEQFTDHRGVTETRHTLRLIRHRIDPSAGFNMSFVRVFHEGNDEFAATGRTCQISLAPFDANKTAAAQTVDFAAIADASAHSARIELTAKSSAGLPVEYFVLKGPGIIQNGAFIPSEVPAGVSRPIDVTIGAYQVGVFKEAGGTKPAETVFRTFRLTF